MSLSIGIVVIGRNEAARLSACLDSVTATGCPVVYVDSGSSDHSVELARQRGVAVVELDPARPFSAARARNEGFARLLQRDPALHAAQFIDGDCTLLPGWLEAADAALRDEPRRGVVVGQLVERSPEASIYNRLCAMEWAGPAGDLKDFGALGGIMVVRTAVFRSLGGFNAEVIAGEDSEFGVRCALNGHTVTKLARPMATHDADIHGFFQWWRRAVRSGHAIGQRARLNGSGPLRDCVRDRRSVIAWGLALPLGGLLLTAPTGGLSLLLVAAGAGVLAMRVYRFRRRRGDPAADAWLYARHLVLAKIAQAWGLATFYLNQARGRFRIIEYK
jgi:GT2 family glycosyltransferase